jgi:2-iminobutanoate/2-iminopropanoate deaminase
MGKTRLDQDPFVTHPSSDFERIEMDALGLLDPQGNPLPVLQVPGGNGTKHIDKHVITNHGVLNEAYDYDKPSSFTRGLRILVKPGMSTLYVSGTASIDDHGETIYKGDFRAQCWRTLRNITELLAAEGANWHDIVRTTCYLRDIERDYDDFNQVRTHFYAAMHLNPLPASTGIQVRLCREDLLVEIEAIAILPGEST